MPQTTLQTADAALGALAARTGALLLARRWRVALAESCTGGWIAKLLTDIPGSSQWFERGYVSYSNPSKEQALGVAADVLTNFGAVSRAAAEQMAAGALRASATDLALAVTGIAGPDGGTPAKPVGLVWFGLASRGGAVQTLERRFPGDRDAVRRAAVATGLGLLIAAADGAVAAGAPASDPVS
jgi:nicotinamide-nucleotide amidase